MTNFKLTDENGVEWVKVSMSEYAKLSTVNRCAISHPVDGDTYYVRADCIPKPKDRFEEMAEKAIVISGHWISLLDEAGVEKEFRHSSQAHKDAELIRSWFAAHARKIDADATERLIKKLEAMRINTSNGTIYDSMLSRCIAELSK